MAMAMATMVILPLKIKKKVMLMTHIQSVKKVQVVKKYRTMMKEKKIVTVRFYFMFFVVIACCVSRLFFIILYYICFSNNVSSLVLFLPFRYCH